MQEVENRKEIFRLRRFFLPLVVLVICLIMTFSVGYYLNENNDENLRKEFDLETQNIIHLIDERFKNYEQVLTGGTGLFYASERVDRDEWSSYVSTQNIQERFPGIQGVGYSEFVGSKENLEAHIDEVRKDYPEYEIKPAGDRAEYHAIVFLEPLDVRNQQAIGYDMYSQETRRNAMNIARESGRPALTGKVTLVQEIDEDVQAGFLLYLPLYKKEFSTETSQQRISAFKGLIYSPFRMNDFMDGLFGDGESDTIHFEIYDEEILEENKMYDHSNAGDFVDAGYEPKLEKTAEMDIFGRNWIIVFNERESFVIAKNENLFWILIITGSIISFLLSGIVYFYYNGFGIKAAKITNIVEQISKGNFDVNIDKKLLERKDELGRLANSINRVLTSMKLAVLRSGISKKDLGISEHEGKEGKGVGFARAFSKSHKENVVPLSEDKRMKIEKEKKNLKKTEIIKKKNISPIKKIK